MQLIKQKDKKIGVFGLGLTGISAYEALRDVADLVICFDDSKGREGSIPITPITDPIWTTLDKIVISPGVPHSHPIFAFCKDHNIAITSDIELFIEENPESEFILISGSNGKSTTTTLVGAIILHAGLDYHIGGNIGLPVLSLPMHRKGYVLEVSSFQIDLLNNIKVKIAALLNITPNHLDRYSSFDEYAKSKERLLSFATDYKIIGIDTEKTFEIYEKIKDEKNVIPISTSDQRAIDLVFCDEERIFDSYFTAENFATSYLYSSKTLKGKHNYENIAMSYAICRALGIDGRKVAETVNNFKGLEHRMQYLGKKGAVNFYNDSKATTLIAARAALSSLKNIFWLAGGIFKEYNFDPLDEEALKNIKKAYLFGQSANLFASHLKGKVEYEIFGSMTEAFNKAAMDAKASESEANLLLSPACSSYDQFKNFEERGKKFMQMVDEL